MNNVSIATIIPARNEEKFIANTLSHLLDQYIKPQITIVVNDGSEDRTGEVARSFDGVKVIDVKDRGYAVQGTPILAHIINQGLQKLNNVNFDFVMILGADHILPPNYISTLVDIMKLDDRIAISSGQIKGERSVVPRGSGRLVKADFWRQIGLHYPTNYGFETYLLIKAQLMGYKLRVVNDLVTSTQRPTGKNYKNSAYISYGKSLKALGYSKLYSAARIGILSLKNPKGGLYMMKGYMSKDVEIYDNEFRQYLSNLQHKRIKKYLVNPTRAFLHGEAA